MLVGPPGRLGIHPLEDRHDERTGAVLVLTDVDLLRPIGGEPELGVRGAVLPDQVQEVAERVASYLPDEIEAVRT